VPGPPRPSVPTHCRAGACTPTPPVIPIASSTPHRAAAQRRRPPRSHRRPFTGVTAHSDDPLGSEPRGREHTTKVARSVTNKVRHSVVATRDMPTWRSRIRRLLGAFAPERYPGSARVDLRTRKTRSRPRSRRLWRAPRSSGTEVARRCSSQVVDADAGEPGNLLAAWGGRVTATAPTGRPTNCGGMGSRRDAFLCRNPGCFALPGSTGEHTLSWPCES
jgi:hypothetical protein